jgi:hypothetical protein
MIDEAVFAVNEELQSKGYFVVRHSDALKPREIRTDITPLRGHKVVIIGPASPEDIEEFDATNRQTFPHLSEAQRRQNEADYPYVYRAIAE